MLLALLSACRSDPEAASATLAAEDTWSVTERVTFPVITVAPDSPACFDWSGLTRNPRGDAYEPTGGDSVHVVRWDATLAAVVADEVDANDTRERWLASGDRQGKLCLRDTTFGRPGAAWTMTLDGREHRDLLPVHGAVVGVEEGATTTSVVLEDDDVDYDFLVTLPDPLVAPAGVPELTYDWSAVPDDDSFEKDDMDEVLVARFDAGPDELASVLDARLTAAVERYTVPVGQGLALTGVATPDALSVPLADAVDAEGAPFPGFSRDGTWIVAATCVYCWTVPPPILSVVEVDPQAERARHDVR